MHSFIRRTAAVFSKLTAGAAFLSMLLLFLIVFINAVRRYTIGKSFEWGEQLPIFITIYGVMFGMALAYLQDRHVRFTLLVGFLSKAWNKNIALVVDLLMAVNGAFLAYSGWMFTVKRGGLEACGLINFAQDLSAKTGWESMLWLGTLYPYQAAIIVGGILLCAAALIKFALRLTDMPSPPKSLR